MDERHGDLGRDARDAPHAGDGEFGRFELANPLAQSGEIAVRIGGSSTPHTVGAECESSNVRDLMRGAQSSGKTHTIRPTREISICWRTGAFDPAHVEKLTIVPRGEHRAPEIE